MDFHVYKTELRDNVNNVTVLFYLLFRVRFPGLSDSTYLNSDHFCVPYCTLLSVLLIVYDVCACGQGFMGLSVHCSLYIS